MSQALCCLTSRRNAASGHLVIVAGFESWLGLGVVADDLRDVLWPTLRPTEDASAWRDDGDDLLVVEEGEGAGVRDIVKHLVLDH